MLKLGVASRSIIAAPRDVRGCKGLGKAGVCMVYDFSMRGEGVVVGVSGSVWGGLAFALDPRPFAWVHLYILTSNVAF